MKEIEGRFEDVLDDLEKFSKNPQRVAAAVKAVRAFSKAVDALEVKFEPEDGETANLYYTLVRKYYLDNICDIEGYIDDGDVAG